MERGRAALRASRLSGRGRVCRCAVGVALWALSSVVSAFVPLTVRLLCAFSACFAHPRSSCPLAGAGGGAGGGECGRPCGACVSPSGSRGAPCVGGASHPPVEAWFGVPLSDAVLCVVRMPSYSAFFCTSAALTHAQSWFLPSALHTWLTVECPLLPLPPPLPHRVLDSIASLTGTW
jgi:hypothetical protein